MELDYVEKLVQLVSDSNVQEIEIEEEGRKIRVTKATNNVMHTAQVMMPAPSAAPQPVFHAPLVPVEPTASAETASSKYHEIKSPIVGTYYRAPAPDAAPFVQVGTDIRPGAVLCIVEAMKLMNEIESDVSGTIVKMLVENGQPVEYDQTLFLVELS